jgi:ribonuclease HI
VPVYSITMNPYIRIINTVPAKLSECWLVRFDGGAVPNPGACGSGAVLYGPDGRCLWERGEFIARGTNNIAEYTGLLIGLELALQKGVRSVKVEGDSMLVIKQITGTWKVKDATLRVLYERVMKLIVEFDYFVCRHVYRENNTHADALTNELQETRTSFVRAFTNENASCRPPDSL